MRNMSFSHTIEQIKNGTKTVTRRLGWWQLKPGTHLMAVNKVMGFKKGEKQKKIRPIRVVSVGPEKLSEITQEDVVKEGFPDLAPEQFIEFFCEAMNCDPDTIVNRIEFEYPTEQDFHQLLADEWSVSNLNDQKINRIKDCPHDIIEDKPFIYRRW